MGRLEGPARISTIPEALLEVRDLHTQVPHQRGASKAVNGVSLTLRQDGVLEVVGEVGSGLTVTALSILNLVPFPGRVVIGDILYKGIDLLGLSDDQLRRIWGEEISKIFQDAAVALNPVLTIGR